MRAESDGRAEQSAEGRGSRARPHLSGDVAGFDLLDDGSVDDVVDGVPGQIRAVQQAPGESPTELATRARHLQSLRGVR